MTEYSNLTTSASIATLLSQEEHQRGDRRVFLDFHAGLRRGALLDYFILLPCNYKDIQ